MISLYLNMKEEELGRFLEEASQRINKPHPPWDSLSFGDLELRGSLSITLTPGNRLHLVLDVCEAINKSARGITATFNKKGE